MSIATIGIFINISKWYDERNSYDDDNNDGGIKVTR